jgi:phosphoglucosamine mutase
VDADDNVFDGYDLLYILASHFNTEGYLRGNTVVTTHQANRGLEHALREIGIDTMYTNNGDRHLEAAIWGKDYLLGGEPGGNIIINDGYHTAADAIYTAMLVGGVLIQNPQIPLIDMTCKLREILQEHPQRILSLRLPVGLNAEQRKLVQEEVRKRQNQLGEGSRIKVWNSSTEPGVYRVMVEGCCREMEQDVLTMARDICGFLEVITNTMIRNSNLEAVKEQDENAYPDGQFPSTEMPGNIHTKWSTISGAIIKVGGCSIGKQANGKGLPDKCK